VFYTKESRGKEKMVALEPYNKLKKLWPTSLKRGVAPKAGIQKF
jgi:hypothetical protein